MYVHAHAWGVFEMGCEAGNISEKKTTTVYCVNIYNVMI